MFWNKILTTFFLLASAAFSMAQKGKVEGKVIDANSGAVISGVSVLVNGRQGGVASDMDGKFILTLVTGKYSITLSSVGYATKEIPDVLLTTDQIFHLDVTLSTVAKAGNEIIIKTTARKESVNALISYQKNTNTVSQVISAEAIRRSPDKNTGEILKRVPGASVLEGKYLVVRGLADRYNQAMLNGILLGSTEPDRKTFSFDILPASMIDNIIMNKAFVPELPGEWAGGLVQVNTKDIPSANFFNIQAGSGFNTQTINKSFVTYKGSGTDWLGIDNGFRGLPAGMPLKKTFAKYDQTEQAVIGRTFKNIWTANEKGSPVNYSLQASAGFTGKLYKMKAGGVFAITYNRSNKRADYANSFINNAQGDIDFIYQNKKYSSDVLAGAMANFSLQMNNHNKISFKNILNINTSDYVIERTGKDFILGGSEGQNIKATELGFKQNIFLNSQLLGEHVLFNNQLRFKWYGSFNILDQYIPDQRRIQYIQDNSQAGGPYIALLAGGNSQKSGSRFYSFLNDYNYNAGGDLTKTFNALSNRQTIKAGYALQVKDRLFDGRPFYYQIERDNQNRLVKLPADQIFSPENITGQDNGIVFGELEGAQYRYLANTILNAAYIQFDNQFTTKVRVTWGLRFESFDQLVGSTKKSDPRFVNSIVNDFLPGVNITYKLDEKTNIRLSGSQTVVRPEFRELSPFAFYDFELGATVVGNKNLERTKITNADLRYEIYPRAGELFTAGVFYKYFKNPIELYFNTSGAGSSNTFNFANAEKATGFGVELEFRKKTDFTPLLKNFTATGNISYIFNKVKGINIDRPMQGQSPYLINIGLQYDAEKSGISSTILFNRIGRRILFVGNLQQATGVGVPEIWENPRSVVDLQVVKKLLKNKGELKLNISDILNRDAYFYHDLDNNKKFIKGSKDAVAIDRKYGSTISLTFGYTIK
ncbi:TonB-dependent receptor [soil metagenome]